jgi:hypothetical protein
MKVASRSTEIEKRPPSLVTWINRKFTKGRKHISTHPFLEPRQDLDVGVTCGSVAVDFLVLLYMATELVLVMRRNLKKLDASASRAAS